MNQSEFNKFRDAHYGRVVAISETKGIDYAGDDDAFANFKETAEDAGTSPSVVWLVHFSKHLSAIRAFVRRGQVESEPIEGRIHDAILYLFLLLGLIEDAKDPDSLNALSNIAFEGVLFDGSVQAEGTQVRVGNVDEWVCYGSPSAAHVGNHIPIGQECKLCGTSMATILKRESELYPKGSWTCHGGPGAVHLRVTTPMGSACPECGYQMPTVQIPPKEGRGD